MRNLNGLAAILFVLGGCSTTIGGTTDAQEGPNTNGADGSPLIEQADATPIDEPEILTLTQGTGAPVADANVNCRYGPTGPHTDTSHFRLFPAASIGGSRITEAILPIEVATSPEGTQPATLTLHKLTGDILNGEFVPISEAPFEVPDQVLGEVRVPLNVAVAAGDSIVLEVSMADGAEVRNLRFGYNLEAQTAPTYYASAPCGNLLPIDLATLENPTVEGQTFAANAWLVSLTIER
jgi:hypothetical protein